jgi:hypothetical protein
LRKVLAAVAVAAGVFLLAGGGEALAAHCFPANKPDGAGNIGDVIVNLATGQVTEPTNPGGRTAGGFADVWLDTNGDGAGDIQVANDVFVLNNGKPSVGNPALGEPAALPEGARNSGPGDNLCDGKGVDDVEGCPP